MSGSPTANWNPRVGPRPAEHPPESEHPLSGAAPVTGPNRRRKVIIAIVATVVALFLLCGIGLFVVGKSTLDARSDADRTASAAATAVRQDLYTAAQELWFSPAMRYRGT